MYGVMSTVVSPNCVVPSVGVHSGGCYGYTVEGVMDTQWRVLWGT